MLANVGPFKGVIGDIHDYSLVLRDPRTGYRGCIRARV